MISLRSTFCPHGSTTAKGTSPASSCKGGQSQNPRRRLRVTWNPPRRVPSGRVPSIRVRAKIHVGTHQESRSASSPLGAPGSGLAGNQIEFKFYFKGKLVSLPHLYCPSVSVCQYVFRSHEKHLQVVIEYRHYHAPHSTVNFVMPSTFFEIET